MPQRSTLVLAAVEDLFFLAKISDAARRAGLNAEFVKTENAVLERARQQRPLMVIVDLNANSLQPVKLIETLKAEESLKGVSLIGFVSHVQGELKQRALDAGASAVLARSAFSANLPQILKRHTGGF